MAIGCKLQRDFQSSAFLSCTVVLNMALCPLEKPKYGQDQLYSIEMSNQRKIPLH